MSFEKGRDFNGKTTTAGSGLVPAGVYGAVHRCQRRYHVHHRAAFPHYAPGSYSRQPAIPNPNVIFPGDVLCVPGVLQLPCCVVLSPTAGAPAGIAGAAFAHRDLSGTQAVGIIASLPLPSTLGNFDIYGAEVFIPVIGGFGFQLFKVSEEPLAWGGLISRPAAAFLTPGTRVTVRPGNSVTGVSGAIVLEGTLSRCFQR